MREFIDIITEAKKKFERDVREGKLPATPENIAAATAFVHRKWIERWRERNSDEKIAQYRAMAQQGDRNINPDWYTPPADLTNSCKFTSLFAREVFGGRLAGNADHQYVEAPDGTVIDLNHDAEDVVRLGDRAHHHDEKFWGGREHRESLDSCRPRVADWVEEFLQAIARP